MSKKLVDAGRTMGDEPALSFNTQANNNIDNNESGGAVGHVDAGVEGNKYDKVGSDNNNDKVNSNNNNKINSKQNREEKVTPADTVVKEMELAGAGDCAKMKDIESEQTESGKDGVTDVTSLEADNGEESCLDVEGEEGSCSRNDKIECECDDGKETQAETVSEEKEASSGGKSNAGKKCCAVCQSTEKLRRCSHCKSTWYCSKKCQIEHHPHHSKFCP